MRKGSELVVDTALLEEVAGLVEWPVVLMGTFDEAFLAIPPEVIRATIRANQKCFVLRDPETGGLANKFILTANIVAPDGGQAIAAGNGRVVRARLSDAKFFYDTDLQVKLEDRLRQARRHHFPRKARLARREGEATDPSRPGDSRRSSMRMLLPPPARQNSPRRISPPKWSANFPSCKASWANIMRWPRASRRRSPRRIEDHYKPQGPNDRIPTDPTAIAVALADKFDTLTGFFAIDERPTGSKDPFALRRAALGIIRIDPRKRAAAADSQNLRRGIGELCAHQRRRARASVEGASRQ